MRNRMLFIIGILLFVLGQIGVNFLIYRYKNKNTEIPKVQLRDVEENKKVKKSSFAIMLEQDDGSYAKTSSNSFDQPGYVFNSEKSGCIDINGKKIANSLSYNNTTKSIVVSVSSTAYCYAYFDKKSSGAESLINSGDLWQSGLDGDGYRFVGTNSNNYICFGTTNKTTCTGNTDAYMYRIIGVFLDSSGTKYMKLIKKEALNTAYRWNDSNSDVDWDSSTLKSNLNGTLFLSNTTYMPSGWSNRIKSWTWNTVNTKTYESSGPDYYNMTVKNVYLHEMNKSGAPSGGAHGTATGKIGLMYVSDYLLSLGTIASLEYNSNTNRGDFKGSWMYITNNDTGNPGSSYEWTISRYGMNIILYNAWFVNSDGSFDITSITSDSNIPCVDITHSVRPVFYLNSDEVIKSGSGTISDPYILSD